MVIIIESKNGSQFTVNTASIAICVTTHAASIYIPGFGTVEITREQAERINSSLNAINLCVTRNITPADCMADPELVEAMR
jgi:hypothetical protein